MYSPSNRKRIGNGFVSTHHSLQPRSPAIDAVRYSSIVPFDSRFDMILPPSGLRSLAVVLFNASRPGEWRHTETVCTSFAMNPPDDQPKITNVWTFL